MGKVEAILAIIGAASDASSEQLRAALDDLDALEGIEEEVERPTEKLLGLKESKRVTMQKVLSEIRKDLGSDRDDEKEPDGDDEKEPDDE